jgi:chromosome segregation ATPase
LDKCHEAVQSLEKQRSAQEQIISKTDSDAKRLETKREKILKEIDAEKEKVIKLIINQIERTEYKFINFQLNEFELAPEKSERKIEELREQLEEAEREIEVYKMKRRDILNLILK